MLKTIYLSGKISGLTPTEYNRNFELAERKVYWIEDTTPIKVISPLKLKHPFKFWLGYMIVDIMEQRKCSHIAVQKNWIDSVGSWIELFFARFIFRQVIIFL